jgi:hypothetical protein
LAYLIMKEHSMARDLVDLTAKVFPMAHHSAALTRMVDWTALH